MSPLEHIYPDTISFEYSNTTEAQEKDVKAKFMKMFEVLKEEVNKSLKDIQKYKQTTGRNV